MNLASIETEDGHIRVSGVEKRVCEFIAQRQQFGLAKYKTSVEANPLSVIDWVQHFREELADALVYATKMQEEMLKRGDDFK